MDSGAKDLLSDSTVAQSYGGHAGICQHLPSVYDPYDLWSTHYGVAVRRRFYEGSFRGKAEASVLGLLDWLFPFLTRKIVGAQKRLYPIVIAHRVLETRLHHKLEHEQSVQALDYLRSVASQKGGDAGWSWGLGFPWMSKNGLYGPEIPFVTHTPYVMEALLALGEQDEFRSEALEMFDGTWLFLESLKVMIQSKEQLALSYAPINEPRIVINANAYAAFAYALHVVYGQETRKPDAMAKVKKILSFVSAKQETNGSWFYYADDEPGNFIDCFHSCFVIKNLLKVANLLPELSHLTDPVVDRGWEYINNNFVDEKSGLCRRFAVRSYRDPFLWDIYDQAEYLGLLVDFSALTEAMEFVDRVENKFEKNGNRFCRVDMLARSWGKNFMRWGIAPYYYHGARLYGALREQ